MYTNTFYLNNIYIASLRASNGFNQTGYSTQGISYILNNINITRFE